MITLQKTNLDSLLEELSQNASRWAALGSAERNRYLDELRDSTFRAAARWAEVCCQIKGLDPNSAGAGQEWGIGPMVTLRNLRLLKKQKSRQPRKPVRALPTSLADLLEWPALWGYTYPVEQPAPFSPPRGVVSLVLGAGNVSSIAATDVLHKLFVEDQVVLLKMNPVHEALGPVLEEAFHCLIRDGFLRIVAGDGAAGALACQHPLVQTIHVTGSHKTYEAIRATTSKPITSELGCVSPVIVAPGRWSKRDMAYQARHIAGMLTTNAGFNCNAAQLLVTSRGWPQRQEFLDSVRKALAAVPPRKAYYPGASDRHASFCAEYPQAEKLSSAPEGCLPWTFIPGLDPERAEKAFHDEAFCGVLHETALDLPDDRFLMGAAQFVNEKVWGNLSCTILIDPKSMNTQPWRRAVRELKYGAVGVNVWAGVVFPLVDLPWGAYPGNTPTNIQSGTGFVHNTAGVEQPLKCVLRSLFWTPYLPPWHAGHPRMLQLGKALTEFEYKPNLLALGKVYWHVLLASL